MNNDNWIAYYRENTGSFQEPDWTLPCTMPEGPARTALRDSLAIFQLGETGDGSTLQKWAAKESARDRALLGYPVAVKLFIKEENYHAEMLARMVQHLGGRLRQKHWAAYAFNKIRKVIPCLEYEIQILLSAELIARAYYALLARHVPEPSIQACSARLVRDEIRHISFHAEFFRERFLTWTPSAISLWRWQFRTLFTAAQWLVWWSHGTALKAIGISRHTWAARCRASHHDFIRQSAANTARFTAAITQI